MNNLCELPKKIWFFSKKKLSGSKDQKKCRLVKLNDYFEWEIKLTYPLSRHGSVGEGCWGPSWAWHGRLWCYGKVFTLGGFFLFFPTSPGINKSWAKCVVSQSFNN